LGILVWSERVDIFWGELAIYNEGESEVIDVRGVAKTLLN